MHLFTSLPRRLTGAAAIACAAALVPTAALAATSSPAAPAAHTAGGATARPPQQRQIAETTLTRFKVALTLTRVDTSPKATVTAAG